MSLLDLILDQKIILATGVLALLPLIIAGGFVIRQRVRRLRIELAQRRAARAEQAAIDAERAVALASLADLTGTSASDPMDRGPLTDVAPPAASGILAENDPAARTSEEQAQAESASEGQPANEIQDLLTSVFADDGSSERNETLLRDTQPIDISNLARFCTSVAHQLRASGE